MDTFEIRTKIHFGEGALDRLKELPGNRVLVVADPFVVQSGMVREATGRLEGAGKQVEVFDRVEPDPSVEAVAAGVAALRAWGPDTMVAMGGGSALDLAKLMREFSERVDGGGGGGRIRLVAIPTTSGTGSEVTRVAVVTDRERMTKIPLVSERLLPDEAILDAELVKSVPPGLTADTGMDVFTHALEAYVSRHYSNFSAAMASKAMEIVGAYLLRSYLDANDRHAREKMHAASCLAGLAFNASSLGLNHGIAHALGARFHLPHGRANALALPHVIEYNSGIGIHSRSRPEYDHTVRCYGAIARTLGLQSLNMITTVRSLVNWVEFMMKEMDMPQRVSQAGVCGEGEYMAAVEEMAEAALGDYCTEGNPKTPTKEDVAGILRKMW